MSKPPAFQLYADDFLAGTMHMTTAEVGTYIRLLCHQWNAGKLPSDELKLRRLAGGKVSEAVREKFVEGEEGFIFNARLESVRKEKASYSEKQALIAKLRWDKAHADGLALPTQCDRISVAYAKPMPEVCSPVSSLQSPSPSPKEDNKEDTTKVPSTKFQPPTVEECCEWFKSEGITESEGENFHAFYESNGWKVGKNKMQKWKGAAVGWKSRYLERTKPKQLHRPESNMVQETLIAKTL